MQALKQIIKSKSFSSLIGNGLGALLGVLTFALLARVLSKEVFGPYLIFLAIYGIFETLRIGMVMNPLVRNLAHCKTQEEEDEVVGSTVLMTILLTFSFFVVIAIIYLVLTFFGWFPEYIGNFKWLLMLALFTAPNNYATWYLNAKLHIVSMSAIRILSQLIFIGFIFTFIQNTGTLDSVLISLTLSNLIVSLIAIFMGWSGLQHVFKYTRFHLNAIFHFGKYSMGTLMGSNLLRSTDSFIIGSSILGKAGVAIYNVPTRILEVVEMPLRSFAVTAMPQLAKLHAEGNTVALKYEFERKAGMVFYLLLPIAIVSFILADWVVWIIGGSGYSESALILRFFASYMAILPLDKFAGVMLDTINRPRLNFIKVMIQLTVNIVGDFLGILIFGTLESVAFVSTATFLAGMLFGYSQLNKEMGISFKNVLVLGWKEYTTMILSLIKMKK